MPSFRYQSLTAEGDHSSGTIQAADRASALRELLARGETATSLEITSDADAGAAAIALPAPSARQFSLSLRRSDRPTLNRAEMANFIRELATAIEAGLPLMSALQTVRRQASGKALPVILDFLIERVEAGMPLHQAAREYGQPFDDLVSGMLRAADASGQMSEVLHQLADLLDRSVELRREVLGATIYPMIVAVLIGASIVLLVTVLVPRLMAPLTGKQDFVLPWPTRTLLGLADFLGSYWLLCLVAAVAAWFAGRAWLRVPTNRLQLDALLLRVPVLGQLLRDVAVARFTRTLGTLVSAGLPILSALRIVRDTLGNLAMMQAIDQVQDKVTTGQSLAEPLERSGLFPPLLIQIVNIGERSGRLESMLMHAAGAFDRQVNNSLKLFTKSLPPVLLVVMASIAGFVLMAILLPLLEFQNTIGG